MKNDKRQMENGKCSANHHDHLPLASTVKLTQEHALPAAEQQFAVFERYGYRRSGEARFDVRVGILFAVTEVHAVLRNERAERVQHVARHIRIGVFVDGETGGGVLDVKDDDAFLNVRLSQFLVDEAGKLDQLFTITRTNVQNKHGFIDLLRRRPFVSVKPTL